MRSIAGRPIRDSTLVALRSLRLCVTLSLFTRGGKGITHR
jgi:hypothetical protein